MLLKPLYIRSNLFTLRTGLALVVALLLAVAMLAPSDGQYGFFAPKTLSFVGGVGAAAFWMVLRWNLSWLEGRLMVLLLGGFLFVGFFLAVARFVGEALPSDMKDQAKVCLVTLIATLLLISVVESKLVSFQRTLKILIGVNFLYALVKVFLMCGLALGLGFATEIYLAVNSKYRLMTLGMGGGLSRFQTSLDVFTPFFWLFFFKGPALGTSYSKPMRVIYPIVTAVSIFISFSRFLWAVALVGWLLARIGRQYDRLAWRTVAICGVTALVLLVAYKGDQVAEIIHKRFLSREAIQSDSVRLYQVNKMTAMITDRPLLGSGMGSNAKDREGFSYEVQWVSFVMQFGLVGASLLFLTAAAVLLQYLQPLSTSSFPFLLLYLVWLLSGFTNPFLISLNSGIMYALFFLAARELREDL